MSWYCYDANQLGPITVSTTLNDPNENTVSDRTNRKYENALALPKEYTKVKVTAATGECDVVNRCCVEEGRLRLTLAVRGAARHPLHCLPSPPRGEVIWI